MGASPDFSPGKGVLKPAQTLPRTSRLYRLRRNWVLYQGTTLCSGSSLCGSCQSPIFRKLTFSAPSSVRARGFSNPLQPSPELKGFPAPGRFFIRPKRTSGAPRFPVEFRGFPEIHAAVLSRAAYSKFGAPRSFLRDVGYHCSSPLTFSQQRLFRSLFSPGGSGNENHDGCY
jgi:hypothetical protein